MLATRLVAHTGRLALSRTNVSASVVKIVATRWASSVPDRAGQAPKSGAQSDQTQETHDGTVKPPLTTAADVAAKAPRGVLAMAKKYGMLYMVTYSTLYTVGFGGCFLVVQQFPEVQTHVFDLAERFKLDWLTTNLGQAGTTAAVAFVLNELLEVVRLPVALASMPVLAKWRDRRRAERESAASTPPMDTK